MDGRLGTKSLRTATLAVLAVLLLSACDGTATTPTADGSSQPITGSFEEAARIAFGEIFEIYGTDAEPRPVEVTGDIATRQGESVWRIDGTYEATIDGTRREQRWRFWIGATPDAPLAVVASERRS